METLMEILDKLNEIVQTFIDIFGPELFFVAAIFMLLHCFFGYQLLRVWSTIFGLILGGAIGLLFGTTMEYEVPQVITAVLIAATAMGWVFYQIYLVGIFALFAGAGFVLLHFMSPDASKLFVGIMMSLLGILGVLCVRPFSILVSAAIGGGLGSYFFLAAKGNFDVDTLITTTCVLAALGIICQFFLSAPIKPKVEEESEDEPQKVEKSHSKRQFIERIFVKPIENIQPEEVDHVAGLPTSDDLDRMIAEQMTGVFAVNDFAIVEENVAFEETVEEDPEYEPFDKDDIADISDELLDEMILQAIPEAEEYLPYRDVSEIEIEEDAEIEENAELNFDINEQNDFAVSDYQEEFTQTALALDIEPVEQEEGLPEAELRTTEEIEENIAALEQSIEADNVEEKESIFSNPFKKQLNEDMQLPVLNQGMSLAEAAAAIAALDEAATVEEENEAIAEFIEEITETSAEDDTVIAENEAAES